MSVVDDNIKPDTTWPIVWLLLALASIIPTAAVRFFLLIFGLNWIWLVAEIAALLCWLAFARSWSRVRPNSHPAGKYAIAIAAAVAGPFLLIALVALLGLLPTFVGLTPTG